MLSKTIGMKSAKSRLRITLYRVNTWVSSRNKLQGERWERWKVYLQTKLALREISTVMRTLHR